MLYNNDPNFAAGGTPLGYEIIDDRMVFRNPSGTENINPSLQGSAYSEEIKNKTQKKLENKTTSHAGFSKPKVINNNEKSEHQQQLDRPQLMKCQEARLIRQLKNTRSIIQHIEKDLGL